MSGSRSAWRLARGATAVAVLAICLVATAMAANAGDFQAFFERFRSAAIAGNAEAVASMADFPLRVRGTDDLQGTQSWSREELSARLAEVLGQDAGMTAEPESVRAYLARLQPEDLAAEDDMQRVGPFVFTRSGAAWRLTGVYVE